MTQANLDDGVYNTFSGKLYDHADYCHVPLVDDCEVALRPSVLAGPTCDSIDVLKEDVLLPELAVGDYLYTGQVGAYGWASRTQFNLLPPVKIVAVDFDLKLQTEENNKSGIRANRAPASHGECCIPEARAFSRN